MSKAKCLQKKQLKAVQAYFLSHIRKLCMTERETLLVAESQTEIRKRFTVFTKRYNSFIANLKIKIN